jgi:hypothetical protein
LLSSAYVCGREYELVWWWRISSNIVSLGSKKGLVFHQSLFSLPFPLLLNVSKSPEERKHYWIYPKTKVKFSVSSFFSLCFCFSEKEVFGIFSG